MLKIANSALNLTRRVPRYTRNISTYPEDSKDEIAMTDDGRVIVCWHPEKVFPYECSKPLPAEKPESPSLFKLENKEEVYKIFKNKNEVEIRDELQRLTYTTMHRWFPRSRDKKAKKTPMNRPYL